MSLPAPPRLRPATPPPLRPWQAAAIERFAAATSGNFLAVATPGAGKTTFALTAARQELSSGNCRRIVVVAPTQHLKVQWSEAARAFGIALEPNWSRADGALPADLHGAVVTYQQVASDPSAIADLARGGFAVLDEVHHAADSRSWGDAVREAFAESRRRLSLSGTPFRSDDCPIPFVRYVGDEAVPDYEYGYGDALRDGRVVRPVFFPRVKGEMEWSSPDGRQHRYTFDDKIGRGLAGQRLRTALSPDGQWLPAVLEQAHERLMEIRRRDPSAGAIAIAMDQEHARAIADILSRRAGVNPIVAVSDDPAASRRISSFSNGNDPWIVAVRMVSEGVDIPRLRVGVFATNTTTDLFFRQAVGRLVRWRRGASQRAYMFVPDDARLRASAMEIRRQRRHNLRRDDPKEADAMPEREEAESENDEEQLSLFRAISAVATGVDGHEHEEDHEDLPDEDDAFDEDDQPESHFEAQEPVFRESFQLVAPEADGDDTPEPEPQRPLTRRELREKNADRARILARAKGLDFARVNAELNQRIGIRRITEATEDQLRRRLDVALRWLRQ